MTFVDEMYENGAQGYSDALSFHPYQYATPFCQGEYNPNNPIVQLDDVARPRGGQRRRRKDHLGKRIRLADVRGG